MTLEIIGLYASVLFVFIVGMANWYSLSKRNKVLNRTSGVDDMKAINESISLANQRALEAEVRAAKLEEIHELKDAANKKKFDELALKYEELEAEWEKLKDWLTFRIVFDVTLGTEPSIKKAAIAHIPVEVEQ